jgi:hypothetical protein
VPTAPPLVAHRLDTQIPQHLLEHIPRPRDVLFTMSDRQLVSNTAISEYGTDVVQGIDVHYLGCRASARAPTSLFSRLTVPSDPVAPRVARRSACDDGIMDCEGAPDVRAGDSRAGVPVRSQRCALARIGESLKKQKKNASELTVFQTAYMRRLKNLGAD